MYGVCWLFVLFYVDKVILWAVIVDDGFVVDDILGVSVVIGCCFVGVNLFGVECVYIVYDGYFFFFYYDG